LGSEPQKVNKLVVQDLTLFMVCKVVHEQFEGLSWCDGVLKVRYLVLNVFKGSFPKRAGSTFLGTPIATRPI
jgi:hypothetical protein